MTVYLDNAATTVVDEDIINGMLPFYMENFGNPSSIHSYGNRAAYEISNAKEIIAEKLNITEDEIYFTSGATESNNWALIRAFEIFSNKGKHIITSKIEHDSVLKVCEYLEKERGAQITYIDVNDEGIISIDAVKKAIRSDTIIISTMFVNNEIGTIQPIEEIGNIARENGIFFHVDGVQAINKFEIDLSSLNIDAMSMSGHKIHTPKGIGVLYIRKGIKFKSFIHGGGQQHGRRSGTENVAGIVAMAKAMNKFDLTVNKNIENMRDYLLKGILSRIDGVQINGTMKKRVCNNLNLSFDGCDSEDIILGMDMRGIAVSGGSACEAGAVEASHVLKALGKPYPQVRAAIRFTLSKYNTFDEMDYTIDNLKEVIDNIRKVNGYE